MRVVERPEELEAALESARREAQAGFGDDRVFIERFLPRARHIEVQVLADAHGTVLHLGERECSLQRRHQKVIEESPSPVVDRRLRAAAGRGGGGPGPGRRIRRRGNGRVHRRYENPAEHYFLEMNARLQVEHPVTEFVTGLDLVERSCGSRPASRCIDSRQRCDSPATRSRPGSTPRTPAGTSCPPPGACSATGARAGRASMMRSRPGSVVDTSYDSLLAKVIVHGADRQTALAELDRALGPYVDPGRHHHHRVPARADRHPGGPARASWTPG